MARPGEIKIAVKNRQDSAQEKDYLFFTRVGEFAMYSKILTRSLHATNSEFRVVSAKLSTTPRKQKLSSTLRL